MIPQFMIDEELEELQKSIKSIIAEFQHPELKKHSKVLKKFARALAYSAAGSRLLMKKPAAKPLQKYGTYERPAITPARQSSRFQIPSAHLQIVKQPISYEVTGAPSPGEPEKEMHEFRVIPIYEKQLVMEQEQPENKIIPLITDKFTNRVLVTAEISNNNYIVAEPALNESARKVFEKIKSKSPKNPEKAWVLIEKYVKKYGADPEHKDAIKYYIMNNLFAMSRIEPLLNDKEISVITCESPASYITIKRNNFPLKTNILFETKEDLDKFLQIVALRTNTKLDKNNPVLDVTYRDFRFHCILGLDITPSKFNITRIT